MVMLRPFRPLRYNPELVPDLSAVVAPPYDVISDAYRDVLHGRDAHNVIRLILNRDPDRYQSAALFLEEWCRTGVLMREPQPALCYYVENFVAPDGHAYERAGIIGVVRLEPFSTGRIRPHERTFSRAKEDRLRLLHATRTNLSPIFGLYAGRDASSEAALAGVETLAARTAPDIDLHDDSGARHRLWFVRHAGVIEAVASALAQEEVVIADGHHRYETALAYRDELCAAGLNAADAPHNFILMYLTSMSHPGLLILPTHRVLRDTGLRAADLLSRLRQHFRLTAFALSERPAFEACLRAAPGRFGVALAGSDALLVATVDDPSTLAPQLADLAPAVRGLDVAILDRVILRSGLGIDGTAAAQAGRLTYTHDDEAALDAVHQGAEAAFLINPPRIADVVAVCAAGETMPEKSTYFYPKLLTGLVFHPLQTP